MVLHFVFLLFTHGLMADNVIVLSVLEIDIHLRSLLKYRIHLIFPINLL